MTLENQLLALAMTGASLSIDARDHSEAFLDQLARSLREGARLTLFVGSDDESDLYLRLTQRNPMVTVLRS
jgi:hypothetical protein